MGWGKRRTVAETQPPAETPWVLADGDESRTAVSTLMPADPAARTIIDKEAVRADLGPDRTVWWNSRRSRWEHIDISASRQETLLVAFCDDEQDRLDDHFRQTGRSLPPVDLETVRAHLAANEQALWWDSNGSRWVFVPVSLRAREEALQGYVEDIQDRADEKWRSSGAYRAAVDRAIAESRSDAADRRYDRERAEKRDQAASKRFGQLIEWGLSIPEARAQVAREFPEE